MLTISKDRKFKQVDVFTSVPLQGNPLAVIMESDGLSPEQMQKIAGWTNLSETTFILPATEPNADYQVRIFTPEKELPFAGHPTLGTAHALLEDGIQTKTPNRIVQQCGVGLVEIAIAGEPSQADRTLSFRSPPGNVSQIYDQSKLSVLTDALDISATIDTAHLPASVDMGIRWLIIRLKSALDVLAFVPKNLAALLSLPQQFQVDGFSIYGVYEENQLPGINYEIRAFCIEHNTVVEDPVTGSANACLSRLLQEQGFPDRGRTAQSYLVRQGTLRQRDGRILVTYFEGQPWIGGQATTLIKGTISI
ncbi:hypothetical protein PPL_07582 [Heterostelium album PN500]|uniref:Uncharacterized protein n=1 Tax=Heterostelium pallidum (strain ATCC 26659 / Pp 5 / PN500) TaxID=670386 RepID=D3BGD1_HETP5|nr:hypothetical protein PPL_07582 [Heterostelium album PN500]EFA79531.1 hypothetical protein PPL_07582 [Heterostelium album PN500]|eukprot:XP_020431652.1 hypothetical protein PPL_07582 [Heterostelium album PN500]